MLQFGFRLVAPLCKKFQLFKTLLFQKSSLILFNFLLKGVKIAIISLNFV